MENEKRNRYIVIMVVIALLLVVIAFAIYAIINSKKDDKKLVNVKISQIYSSDYDLNIFDNSYFIGSYKDKVIDVIIDSNGQEVFKGLGDFKYENIYKMKDERYLMYTSDDSKLVTYIFDGTNIKSFYEIDDVTYVKPIIYKGIDNEYIIGFASIVEDDLYLYNLNSEGIVVVNDVSLVGDYNDSGIYYVYNENYLVVKNNDNLMGVIDISGNTVIDCKYNNIINTYDESFIAVNTKGKYGILDKNGDTLIKFKYSVIDYFRDYYLIVDTNNKMALYSKDYQKITEFEMNYDSLIDYDLRSEYNSINLYKIDGKIVVINNYLEDKNGIEYDKHNLYVIDGNTIIKKIKQIGFGISDIVYTYDKEYNVVIYNEQFNKLFEVKLDDTKKIDNISYVSSNVVKVDYLNNEDEVKSIYFDLEGNEVEFDLGELVIKNVDYFGYLKTNKEGQVLTLYDLEGNYLDDISGTKIDIYNEFIIIDKSIYKIIINK